MGELLTMDAADFLHGSCVLAFMLSLIDIAQSVPPDYCLGNFNRSDCGGPPTRVAYYYKPGSRCEIATWRGCPTSNKFRDEVICSHICIARLFKDSAENMILSHSPSPSSENTTEIEEPVEVDDYEEWKHEMEAIEPDEVELMEELLDDIMEEHGRPEIKKLKHASKTTTASTVEPTTETVADVSPADDPATPTTTSSTQITDSTTVDSTMVDSTTVDSTTAEPTTVATTSMTTTQNIDPGSADEVILT